MEIHRPCFFRFSSYGMENHYKIQAFSSSWKRTMYSNSPLTRNTAESLVQHQKISVPQFRITRLSNLRLYRAQPRDHEYFIQGNRFEFGKYVVREALGEEELWAVAQLWAEIEFEDRPNIRFGESLKKKEALEVFDMLKHEISQKHPHESFCIVAVKKEDSNVTDNVPKSVVGTLDMNMQFMLSGQTYPGELARPISYDPVYAEQSRHGFIDHICVAKSARRQGIASKMLLFAINIAKSNGAKRLYLTMETCNKPALEFYQKMGFQVVDEATAELEEYEEDNFLLCLECTHYIAH